ncbi:MULTISPECIES: sugar-binding transcriptional regulator [Alkalihalophilus]|uniref:Transcriptional regulator, sugar binding, N-terminal sigma factor domain protein n=1 Tax=Alkalihalophilus pseudofirmus (strain ATCC BAA-2126 / JCM 17055 / OF4) TaxID=398511 RepID=D3FY98_ALKPO|nr:MULTISPECIES: sugar-binding domain-containing protein [Alkalihalophilus]ADC49121.1 transcriptional regulator, sugar binding, N-terminal sigma factor domain protein [Alkalihalophilus pseudofirmus OF4]MEC2071202.1 sugar-binding domain-containing protein [Alkalihalophilus marmarensis]
MRVLLDIQQKLLPDLLDVMVKRFKILQYIRLMQPIGRRSLSTNLQMSERVLRTEVTFLKDQGLVHFATSGMTVTPSGEALFYQLEDVMKELLGLRNLEEQVELKLGVKKVLVVAGNSDEDHWVKHELGRASVAELKAKREPSDVIAVMGGTTLAAVAEMMTPDVGMRDVTFVPARGGLGENVENQANTISAELATRAGAQYRLLHVPDQLSEDAYSSLVLEPSIGDILKLIKSARVVIHGIGEANTMASRRGSKSTFIEKIEREQAVAEAFGYYFNREGDIIHKQRTIGLQLDELDNKYVISVAGGESKAEAISAYMKYRPSDVLITDESAARRLLEIE